jgi:hypothetical protein
MGGVQTEPRLPRRQRRRSSTATEIVEALRLLAHACSDDMIAGVLSRNDFRTGRVTSPRFYQNALF